MVKQIDTSRCPLCGEINRCVMAGDEKDRDQPCWCREESFPEELLSKIPANMRKKACICHACVQAYHAAKDTDDV